MCILYEQLRVIFNYTIACIPNDYTFTLCWLTNPSNILSLRTYHTNVLCKYTICSSTAYASTSLRTIISVLCIVRTPITIRVAHWHVLFYMMVVHAIVYSGIYRRVKYNKVRMLWDNIYTNTYTSSLIVITLVHRPQLVYYYFELRCKYIIYRCNSDCDA